MRQRHGMKSFGLAAMLAAGLVVAIAPVRAADPPAAADPNKPDPKSAPPKAADPKGPRPKAEAKGPKGVPALGLPKTPLQHEKALADLYAQLAAAEDEAAAKKTAAQIERLWLEARGDTAGVLMERALGAAHAKNYVLAIKLLDAVVDLHPDFAEGWNRRAYVNFLRNDVQGALGDLRRVLALDPSHFKALDGLAQVLRDIGEKKAALAALRTLIEVHPYWDGAKKAIEELAREVDGRRI